LIQFELSPKFRPFASAKMLDIADKCAYSTSKTGIWELGGATVTIDDASDEKNRRFRSPPYPSISLPKAIERAEEIFSNAQHHSVGINALASAWQLSPQSGGVLKTAAALIHYGLVTDSGTGNGRKFQLTEAARRIVQDNDPSSEKRVKAIQGAALTPMIHREIWERFGSAEKISDSVLKNHLILDRAEEGNAPYSESAALEVIQNFREAVRFSNLTVKDNSGTISVAKSQQNDGIDDNQPNKLAETFPQHPAVTGRHTDSGDTAFGVLSPPTSLGRETDIKVMLDGDIVRVNAVVDARGIKKLIKVLSANLALLEDES
jgi:hypothetical protein